MWLSTEGKRKRNKIDDLWRDKVGLLESFAFQHSILSVGAKTCGFLRAVSATHRCKTFGFTRAILGAEQFLESEMVPVEALLEGPFREQFGGPCPPEPPAYGGDLYTPQAPSRKRTASAPRSPSISQQTSFTAVQLHQNRVNLQYN